MFDYMGAFLFRNGFAHVDNVFTKRGSKTITWLLLSRLQGNKPHRNSPEPFGTCLQNLHQHIPELHQHTPELSGTILEPASRTYTSTHRNSPEPASGTYTTRTCLRNLHQHTPELSGTFWNLPPEPAPQTCTGTHRSLSGLKTPLAYAVGKNLRASRKRLQGCRQILHCFLRLLQQTAARYHPNSRKRPLASSPQPLFQTEASQPVNRNLPRGWLHCLPLICCTRRPPVAGAICEAMVGPLTQYSEMGHGKHQWQRDTSSRAVSRRMSAHQHHRPRGTAPCHRSGNTLG